MRALSLTMLAGLLAFGGHPARAGLPKTDDPSSGAYNIEILAIELNQGSQDLDNTMPLIAGRRIGVRVYARTSEGQTVADVHALMDFSVHGTEPEVVVEGGVAGGAWAAHPAPVDLGPTTVRATLGNRGLVGPENGLSGAGPGWYGVIDLDGQFAWPQDSVTVTVTVNHDRIGEEYDASDNTMSVTRELQVTDPVHLYVAPVHTHVVDEPDTPPVHGVHPIGDYQIASDPFAITQLMRPIRTFPIRLRDDGFQVNYFPGVIYPEGHDAGVEFDVYDWPYALEEAALAIEGLKALHDDPHGFYVSAVSNEASNGGIYVGSRRMAVTFDSAPFSVPSSPRFVTRGGSVLVHEMAHIWGDHIPCGPDEPAPYEEAYPWPYPGCQLAEVDPAGYYGLDVYGSVVPGVDPMLGNPTAITNDPIVNLMAPPVQIAFPILSYRFHASWPSPWELCELFIPGLGGRCEIGWPASGGRVDPGFGSDAFVSAAARNALLESIEALRDAERQLSIAAVVAADDRARFTFLHEFAFREGDAFLEEALSRRRTQSLGKAESGYEVQLRDARGTVLVSHPIVFEDVHGTTPREGGAGRDAASGVFAELLPFPESVAAIAIVDARGVDVAQRDVSRSAPQLVIDAPSTGSAEPLVLGPGSVLRWQGHDADGDALRYSVQYSATGTAPWQVLSYLSDSTSLEFSAERMRSLRHSRSGTLRVLATDGVRGAVAEQRGVVVPNSAPEIHTYAPSEPVQLGAAVSLHAVARDANDGFLVAPSRYTWRDGSGRKVGTGPRVVVSPSLPGRHRFTITAVDRDGGAAQRAVEILVSEAAQSTR